VKVAVVGLGKVGHPLATVLSRHGFEVCGIEISEERIDQLSKIANYKIYNKPGEFLRECEIVFVIVQTPSVPSGKFDLKYVESAVKDVSRYLMPDAIITICSTINVGDIEKLRKYWKNIAYTPLMIALGRVEEDLEKPEYVLIGSDDPKITEVLRSVWKKIVGDNVPFIETSTRNMEIIKLTFNFWLPAKISLLNSTAIFCEKYNGDFRVVAEALKHDTRLAGKRWWNEFGAGAGIGFGGPCFPRDIRNWEAHLPENVLVKAVERINVEMVERSVNLIRSFGKKNVVFLGVTYKAGTNLTVDSQALKILEQLKKFKDLNIYVYDPTQPSRFSSAKEAVKMGEVIFIAVPWLEFARLEPHDFREDQIVIDPWRVLVDKKLPCKHYAYGIGWVR